MADKQDKAAAKEAKASAKQGGAKVGKDGKPKATFGQLLQTFSVLRKEDKTLVPWLLGTFVVVAGVVFGIGWLLGHPWIVLPLAVLLAVLATLIMFGTRARRSAYQKYDGQPGAAMVALDQLRGRWKVTPTVAATTQFDAVHRVLGRPGVILIADGAAHRVKPLLAQEKKRVSRLIGDIPIYDVSVGSGDDQVPLRKLQAHIMKLPRNISNAEVDGLERRLAALASKGNAMPKGPLPQGAKMRSVQRTMRRR